MRRPAASPRRRLVRVRNRVRVGVGVRVRDRVRVGVRVRDRVRVGVRDRHRDRVRRAAAAAQDRTKLHRLG